MKDWVLDSSLALAWALPDETSEKAERFLERLSPGSILCVPALWWYEISNALIMAQRRRRLVEADRLRLVGLYEMLPIETDMDLGPEAIRRIQAIARDHALSGYDAAYVELAQRLGLGLATLDRRLLKAAQKDGIPIL
jgi:predicted nucleic acid-binding protein